MVRRDGTKTFQAQKFFFGSGRPEIPFILVEECIKRRLKLFGCDLPSVDVSGSKMKPVHNALLSNNIIIYESLTNLNLLPIMEVFAFQGFPLPLSGLDGSPVRAIACFDRIKD